LNLCFLKNLKNLLFLKYLHFRLSHLNLKNHLTRLHHSCLKYLHFHLSLRFHLNLHYLK
jgi:hypothetical protein